jgi:hypothetical protein
LGVTPDVEVSQRASKVLAAHREESRHRVWELGTVVAPRGDELWWFTWAGGRGNARLAAALDHIADIGGQPETTDCCHARRSIRPNFEPRWTTWKAVSFPRPWSRRKRYKG